MNNNNILILVTFTVLIILLLIKTINEKENFIVYSSVESQVVKNDNPQKTKETKLKMYQQQLKDLESRREDSIKRFEKSKNNLLERKMEKKELYLSLNQDIDKRINKMEQQKINNNQNLANLNQELKKVENKLANQNKERQKYFSNKKNENQEKIANL